MPAQRLTATSSPSPTESSALIEPLVVADRAAELAQRRRLAVADGRVGHPVVPEHVVVGDDAARAQQPQRLLVVDAVAGLVGVDVDQVVRRRRSAGAAPRRPSR